MKSHSSQPSLELR